MKKVIQIIFTCILTTISNQADAQVSYNYDTSNFNIYRQFEGEWRYTNGNDTIRFYFRAHRNFSSQGDFGHIYVYDRLVGWHEYKRGNTVIESNYNNRMINIPNNAHVLPWLTISIHLAIDQNFGPETMGSRRLFGHINDIGLNGEMIRVFSAIFSSNLQTLEWSQWRTDFSRNPESAIMTLPCCFTLTKQ